MTYLDGSDYLVLTSDNSVYLALSDLKFRKYESGDKGTEGIISILTNGSLCNSNSAN